MTEILKIMSENLNFNLLITDKEMISNNIKGVFWSLKLYYNTENIT